MSSSIHILLLSILQETYTTLPLLLHGLWDGDITSLMVVLCLMLSYVPALSCAVREQLGCLSTKLDETRKLLLAHVWALQHQPLTIPRCGLVTQPQP